MKRLVLVVVLGAVALSIFLLLRDPENSDFARDNRGGVESGERSRAKRLRELANGGGVQTAAKVDDPKKSATVAGRVLNRVDGSPVADARISIDDPSGRPRTISTDAHGAFLLDGAAPGVHVLVGIAAEKFLPWEGSDLWSLKAGDRIEGITLMLTPAVEYRGLVLDQKKKPVEGAAVRVLGSSERATSDAKGSFVFHAADQAVVEARHPTAGMGRAVVTPNVQITHKLEITLDPAASYTERSLAGTVVDSQGHGIAGAKVWAAKPNESGKETVDHLAMTHSARDGQFTLVDVEAGELHLEASAEGFVTGSAKLAADEKGPLKITLLDACPVDLALVGTENTAESKLMVGPAAPPPNAVHVNDVNVAIRENKGLAPDALYETMLVLDGRGRATFAGVGPGSYLVELHATGFAPAAKPLALSVPEGCGDLLISGELGRGFTLRGEVLEEETQAPLPWTLVDMDGNDPTDSRRTDAQGHFEYRGISPGLHSFRVVAGDHNSRIIGPLEFNAAFPERTERVLLSKVKEGEQPTLELAGIGVGLSAKGDELEVTAVLPNGGASIAGLKVGDHVLAVDGVSVAELGFDGTMQHIRGPVGTPVRLSLTRAGNKTEITVTRTKIKA